MAIKRMSLRRAQRYLENVLKHKEAIPFRRYNGGLSRHAQAKQHTLASLVRWPKKSCEVLLGLLKNAESNAEAKGLDIETLHVSHIQVNRAPSGRRRTYRAHGRINAYMSHPCHIEMILTEKRSAVKKAKAEKDAAPSRGPKKVSQKKLKRERLRTAATQQ